MKKGSGILITLLILAFGVSSCKKATVSVQGSQWTFNGITHTGSSTIFATAYATYLMEANEVISDSLTNYVMMEFGNLPANNEKFSVVSTATPDSGQCVIALGYITAAHIPTLVAKGAGSSTDSVLVTIVNGKYHFSFSGIVMNEYETFTGLSGTLIQQ
ncbi:MAG TPA: hypothetical protein VK718_12560 [Ferruginibacter sp.]|jgi:hypothetical protein|nr:hypothetical protein [Ferruginibacter sp.]